MAEYRQPSMDWNRSYPAAVPAASGGQRIRTRVILLAAVIAVVAIGAYLTFSSGAAPPADQIRQAAPTPDIPPDIDKPGM